jgi:hypothetical protein
MNVVLRNFPKPPLAVVHSDCGLSERREIVARICDRTNEVSEYVLGMDTPKVLVPAQSNIDERMPLYFLRPCIDVINAIIVSSQVDVPKLDKPGDNMDYHQFVPLTRRIGETLNAIVEEL